MADQNQISNLSKQIEDFNKLELKSLLRPTLGTLSMESDLIPLFKILSQK